MVFSVFALSSAWFAGRPSLASVTRIPQYGNETHALVSGWQTLWLFFPFCTIAAHLNQTPEAAPIPIWMTPLISFPQSNSSPRLPLNWNTHLPFPSFFAVLEAHPCFFMANSVKAQRPVKTCPYWKMRGSSKTKIKTEASCNWNEVCSQLWGHEGIFQNTTRGVWKEFRWAMLVFNLCQCYRIHPVPWVFCECERVSWPRRKSANRRHSNYKRRIICTY